MESLSFKHIQAPQEGRCVYYLHISGSHVVSHRIYTNACNYTYVYKLSCFLCPGKLHAGMWSSHASSLLHCMCMCMIQDWFISGYLYILTDSCRTKTIKDPFLSLIIISYEICNYTLYLMFYHLFSHIANGYFPALETFTEWSKQGLEPLTMPLKGHMTVSVKAKRSKVSMLVLHPSWFYPWMFSVRPDYETPEHSGVLFRVFIRIPRSYSVFPKLYYVVFLLKDGTMKKKKKENREKVLFNIKLIRTRFYLTMFVLFSLSPYFLKNFF